jgi:hypothetical protein
MTKQHFIALADKLRASKPPSEALGRETPEVQMYRLGKTCMWNKMRDELADFCASQNPRFDRSRWLGYIAGENGPNGGKVTK